MCCQGRKLLFDHCLTIFKFDCKIIEVLGTLITKIEVFSYIRSFERERGE